MYSNDILNYAELKLHARDFLALTGITDIEFQAILPHFKIAITGKEKPEKTKAGEKRKRKVGAGRKPKLACTEDQLLFVLVYQKTYPVQVLLARTYGMSQGSTNGWIHQLLPKLKQALDAMDVLPERNGRELSRTQATRTGKKSKKLIIDGTERRVERPKDAEEQRKQYSGKRKAHTNKNVVVSEAQSGRVVYLSQTYAGKTHDKKIADEARTARKVLSCEQEARISYPEGTVLYQDTGFQGYAPRVKKVLQPKKTKKEGVEQS